MSRMRRARVSPQAEVRRAARRPRDRRANPLRRSVIAEASPETSVFCRTDPRHPSGTPSQLFYGRDLDEELLRSHLLELHVCDAFGTDPGDVGHPAVAEVGVTDAISRHELQVAVVAHLTGHPVGPLGLR